MKMPYRGYAVGRVPGVAWCGAGLLPHPRAIDQRPAGRRRVERFGRGRTWRVAGLDGGVVRAPQSGADDHRQHEGEHDDEGPYGGHLLDVAVVLGCGHCRPLPGAVAPVVLTDCQFSL